MEEPSLRNSRLALAGGLAVAILVGSGGFLLGRATTERPPAVVDAPPRATPPPAPAPEPAAPRGVLARADLIALAAAAANASAAGRDPAAEIAEAERRRFEVRLPFGCNGPAAEDSNAAMRWRYDADDQALRIHVAPVSWTAEDWGLGGSDANVEAVEGFWIERPWTASESCPARGDRPAAVGVDPVTLPGQTLALGQIVSEGARGGTEDVDLYQVVVRVPEGELDVSSGLRLRLTGRIEGADAGPVRCRQPAGAEQRPICLVNVVMDEVAIENPATDAILATWSVARRDMPAG